MQNILIIAILGLLIIFYLSFFLQPRNMVYLYIILWLFFPHGMKSIAGHFKLETSFFSYYFILKSIVAISLLIAVLGNFRFFFSYRSVRPLAHWFMVFWVMICVFGLIRVLVGVTEKCYLNFGMHEAEIFTILDMMCNAIFLSGMIMFIREFSHFEQIMNLFIVAGMVTVIDFVFLYKMNLVPYVSHIERGINIGGRYRGIIQNDYVSMGRFCMMAVGASMYFWLVKKKHVWLILSLILAYIAFYTYQRTTMIMVLIVFTVSLVCWIKLNINRINMWTYGAVVMLNIAVLITLFAVFPPNKIYIESRGGTLTDPQSLYTRMFLFINGIKLFANHFVAGVGPGESQYCLIELLKNSNLSNPIFSYDIEYFQKLYVAKGVHNMYLALIAEFGLPGVVVVVWWFSMFIKLWQIIRRKWANHIVPDKIKTGIAVSFGILIANTFNSLLDHNYYWFVFMLTTYLPFLLYRSSLNSKEVHKKAVPGSEILS